MNKSMIAVRSVWGENKTFRTIPINENCPYVEGIYDPQLKVMVFISKLVKNSYHMLPVLDSDGEPMPAKKKKGNGKPFKEERRLVETFQEYYIIDRSEMDKMLDMFCINYGEFDFASYLDTEPIPAVQIPEGVNIDVEGMRTGDGA